MANRIHTTTVRSRLSMSVIAGTVPLVAYIRLAKWDQDTEDQLHDQAVTVARAAGHQLRDAFIDRNVADDCLERAAIDAAFQQYDHPRILVTDLNYLSPLPTVRIALLARVVGKGGSIVTAKLVSA